MRGKTVLVFSFLGFALAGTGLAGYLSNRSRPSRLLGWNLQAKPAAALEAANAPGGRSAADSILGFSRLLPPEIDHYYAVLQSGRVFQNVSGSAAYRRLMNTPELKALLGEAQKEFDPAQLPPQGRKLLDLFAAAFDTEFAIALPTETLPGAINFAKAVILSGFLMSPAGRAEIPALAQKQKNLRQAWEASLSELRIPPLVLAARGKDGARFDEFVKEMLEEGWRGFLDSVATGVPAEVQKALKASFGRQAIGKSSLYRLRLKFGDLMTTRGQEAVLGSLPLGNQERQLLLNAVRRLAVDIHFGFLGEYLILSVSEDDRLIRKIVERHEGSPAATLASSKAFDRLRPLLTPDCIGITWSDDSRIQGDLRALGSLIGDVLDPQFLFFMNLPPPQAQLLQLVKRDFEAELRGNYLRQEELVYLDRGIRRLSRAEYAGDPPPLSAEPLVIPSHVPREAAGFYAVKNASLDGLWDLVRYGLEQYTASFERLKVLAGGDPQVAEAVAREEAMVKSLLAVIDQKLAPALRGELGFILGPPARVSIPELGALSVPTVALVGNCARPEQVLEGLQDLLRLIATPLARALGGPNVAPRLVKGEIEGLEIHALQSAALQAEGFEPHFAVLGEVVVFSTSRELTRQIRTAGKGEAGIALGNEYQAMGDLSEKSARELSFIDGPRMVVLLYSVAEGILSALDRSGAWGSPRGLTRGRAFLKELLSVAGSFRGHAAVTVREGTADVRREWIRVQDIAEK